MQNKKSTRKKRIILIVFLAALILYGAGSL